MQTALAAEGRLLGWPHKQRNGDRAFQSRACWPLLKFTAIIALLAFTSSFALFAQSAGDLRDASASRDANSLRDDSADTPAITSLFSQTTATQAPDGAALPRPVRVNQSTSFQPAVPAEHLTFGERFHIYLRTFARPSDFLSPGLGAAYAQALNEPPEWGQGWDAYAVRAASSYGRLFIGQTIRFGIAAADGEDPRSQYSREGTFWHRTRFAIVHVFVSRTDRGTEMPAYSRLAGIYGAAFIANAWYPASRADTKHAMIRGSYTLGTATAWAVFREFWPDIKKRIFK